MMDTNKAKALLKRYLAGTCTEEEKALLETWYLQQKPADFRDMGEAERLQDMGKIRRSLHAASTPVRRLPGRFAQKAAAVVALCLLTGLWIYMHKADTLSPAASEHANDVNPGGNRAILSFEGGPAIELSTDKEGIVTAGGALTYEDGSILTDAAAANDGNVRYASLTTPAGGQYKIVLSDGTRIWLNAATTLRYPLTFNGSERRVEVNGEAYFEVAHDASTPFRVSTQQQTVEVLGTHFNVSAYDDEHATKTTLLEGAVKVISGSQSAYLSPGQQAAVTADEHIRISDQPDLESVVSWKDGYFKFNENIEGIMSKIARWYDVEIVYQEGVDLEQTFSGEMSRSRDLSALLKLMEVTGNVHFRIEGRRVIVMP